LLNLGLSGLIKLSNSAEFPMLVPTSFVSRMHFKKANDPLLLQILPIIEEQKRVTGYTMDPLKEYNCSPISGVIHKYKNRVLLLVTNNCAMNCRFCFRRHNKDKVTNWSAVIKYIAANKNLHEVILSGGDPLILDSEILNKIINKLAKIKHIQRLRIHTRLPIIEPRLINKQLVAQLTHTRFTPIIVVHCNHPNEINAQVASAVQRLRKTGITVFNQSVLLKNINDDAQVLAQLSNKLFSIGVIPYYLHFLDKVAGAAHFAVTREAAKKIYAELATLLPGYLLPKLVRDLPSASAKVQI
jgi:L-lysine 2,3-aminomutase